MIRNLAPEERQRLIQKHRKERNRKVCDRIKAVLMHDDGYSYSEIARILLIDDETIRRHILDYFKKNKLKGESGGSVSQLSEAQAQELTAHLNEKTYLYVKDICTYVHQTYGIKYSISGMTSFLKRQGFRYKKPQPVPGKVDPERQEEFAKYYEKLKREVAKSETIYFVDSVHPQHQTKLAYGWIKKGVRKNIATTGRQKRLNFMGGICLDGHKVVAHQSEKVDANSIKKFLDTLRKKHKGDHIINIIWDNAGYHRSKDVQAYAAEKNIKLHYLPPYSPNLNPIERLWKIMHEQITYNRYYETFADFSSAVSSFFKSVGRKKKILRERITDKFQIMEKPNFAL